MTIIFKSPMVSRMPMVNVMGTIVALTTPALPTRDRRVIEWMYTYMDIWMDERTDGWVDRWV